MLVTRETSRRKTWLGPNRVAAAVAARNLKPSDPHEHKINVQTQQLSNQNMLSENYNLIHVNNWKLIDGLVC